MNDPQSKKKQTKTSAVVFASLSLVAWIIPIIGIPVSILAIVYASRSLPAKLAVASLIIAIITLVAGSINAFIGAVEGYRWGSQAGNESSQDIQRTEISKDSWGYPAGYDSNFMNSCTNNGGNWSACSCSLTLLKTSYSYDTVAQYEARGALPPGFANKASQRCS